MKKQVLFGLWAAAFIVCAGLGFIPDPQGGVRGALTLLALLCFVPPFWLLIQARKQGDCHTITLVRNLSIASLGTTAVMLMLNFLSVLGSEALGDFLYSVLIVVSSPMVCSGSWGLSLFLWACLLMVSLKKNK